MKIIVFFFALLFAATGFTQTYTPINGKIVITVTQATQDGGEVITRTGELDSLEAANRFFNSLVATNQRIGELRVEVDELERQSNRANKAFKDLGGQDADQKVADLYGTALIGQYTITDTTSVKDCDIRLNAQGRLVLRVGTTNYPLRVMSNQFYTISNLVTGAALEFVQRGQSVWIYSERGRRIILTKKPTRN